MANLVRMRCMCGTVYDVSAADVARGRGKFCSLRCVEQKRLKQSRKGNRRRFDAGVQYALRQIVLDHDQELDERLQALLEQGGR